MEFNSGVYFDFGQHSGKLVYPARPDRGKYLSQLLSIRSNGCKSPHTNPQFKPLKKVVFVRAFIWRRDTEGLYATICIDTKTEIS